MQTETAHRLAQTYHVGLTAEEAAALGSIMDCRRLAKGVPVTEPHRHNRYFIISFGTL